MTCGDSDLARFLPNQLDLDGLEAPPAFGHWLNFQTLFARAWNVARLVGLRQMLAVEGLRFRGRPHHALTDALALADLCHAFMLYAANVCVKRAGAVRVLCFDELGSRVALQLESTQ